MSCVFTIGHSNLSFDDFAALLRENGVAQLADVRRFPGSKRNPQFRGEALQRTLVPLGIAYQHFEDLGGYRKVTENSPHTAWEHAGFRGYADHMESRTFRRALQRLEAWARSRPTVAMCAEQHPSRCHRRMLSDALLRDGLEVVHLLGPGRRERHVMTPLARRAGGRLIYDAATSGDLWDQE